MIKLRPVEDYELIDMAGCGNFREDEKPLIAKWILTDTPKVLITVFAGGEVVSLEAHCLETSDRTCYQFFRDLEDGLFTSLMGHVLGTAAIHAIMRWGPEEAGEKLGWTLIE